MVSRGPDPADKQGLGLVALREQSALYERTASEQRGYLSH